MPKSLITGGAGFIGSHVAELLAGRGHELVIVDDLSSGRETNAPQGARFYRADIRDPRLGEIFQAEQPDFVFHLAAQTDLRRSAQDPALDADINLRGSMNVFESAARCRAQKVIFASTGGAMYSAAEAVPTPDDCPESPSSPYGAHKLEAERALVRLAAGRFDYAILRIGNVYGPRQDGRGETGVVAIFLEHLLSGKTPMVFGDGEQTRDYVFVRDAARAFLRALDEAPAGCFNIGSGRETSVNELLALLAARVGATLASVHVPARPVEQRRSCLNSERAARQLGWRPEYTLEEGLEETLRWFRQQA